MPSKASHRRYVVVLNAPRSASAYCTYGYSSTVVAGLTPGTTMLFRYKVLTKKGESDWSGPIAYFVD